MMSKRSLHFNGENGTDEADVAAEKGEELLS
jgi:hypothetical protein